MFCGRLSLFALTSLILFPPYILSSPQSFWPAALPVAVRSPYLSAWQYTNAGAAVLSTYPQTWPTGTNNLGWVGHIRVDGTTYRWLGAATYASTTANLTSFEVTPTRTIFNVQAGPMDVTVTFLSPIEPSDWVRQSIPFSYVAVNASSNDGKAHVTQFYSDITAEWASGNRSEVITWSTTETDEVIFHQIQVETPTPYTEVNGQTDDGVVYFSTNQGPEVSYQSGGWMSLRDEFEENGSLNMSRDPDFRPISDNWPTFALAIDLGDIQETASPVVFAIGYVRDPSIKYTTATGVTQLRSLYFRTQYSDVVDLIVDFLSDFGDALTRSGSFDNQLSQDASSISTKYSQIISLATRQVFGAIDIAVAVGNGTDGSWNMSDVMIFMRNMGIDQRVNPVEILYASFPAFLYLNASFGKPLLAPLLEYQNSPRTALPYAVSDLGTSYPIASGEQASVTESSQGVEQSGNMLIMTLAHARLTGDGYLISQHYDLLKNWANYLIKYFQAPTSQVDADDQRMANMTNLAIKGIIGIQAMAEMSKAIGNMSDYSLLASAAATFVKSWQSGVVSSGSNTQHLLFDFGDEDSWALMYNLYADRLLQTNLVSASTQYYQTLLSSADGSISLEYDSDANGEANDAWISFTAATASNPTVRNGLLSLVWAHASSNSSPGIFPAMYAASTGNATQGFASPAQGGAFAPLALELSNQTIKFPSSTSSSTSSASSTGFSSEQESTSKVPVGAIVGGVVGGVAAFAAVIVVTFFVWRRRHQTHKSPPDGVVAYVSNCGEQSTQPTQNFASFMPQKSRRHLQAPVSVATPSDLTIPSVSRDPSSTINQENQESVFSAPAEINRTPSSPPEFTRLRQEMHSEMQNLRRVMEQIAAPPEYTE
ncbi:uncharacterized protein FIBRA_04884 [Fibroporia radiculosa]|uniref:DUF1793-domain-containing protein n=1 Tax=Fibroporia radiculosa TaxID=599839 RepID=J4IAE6_9APHY|nr:uncharacterized protein FIBRA_04884 [Fibroporia radiculosa]CCM02776.1 predicted protein [Fibroporia radiculosa]